MSPRFWSRRAGRLGYPAAEAFRDAGWKVASLVRPGAAARAPTGTEPVEVDALDHAAVTEAARGADVVLHALNPPYTEWSRHALPLAYSAITAAETAGATLLFPGNLYNYGSPLPPVIDEATPMRPTSRKGRLRVAIEDRMEEAAERGLRTIIVRAGDFFGGGRRIVARPRDRQGDRPRPPDLSGTDRPGARMGLSARSGGGAGAACRHSRNGSAPSRRSAFPAMPSPAASSPRRSRGRAGAGCRSSA